MSGLAPLANLVPAIRLYEKLGFKRIDGPPSPYRRADIPMELVLREPRPGWRVSTMSDKPKNEWPRKELLILVGGILAFLAYCAWHVYIAL